MKMKMTAKQERMQEFKEWRRSYGTETGRFQVFIRT